MYERRNEVEHLFQRLKGDRRIFSRFEKLDLMFLDFISIVLVFDGLRMCQQALLVSLRRCCGDAANGGCRASNFSRHRVYELVVDLKTAKRIGVTNPQGMLDRADKVIE